jgi:hypothetical protein
MLSGTRVLSKVCMLVTLASWSLLPQHQPGRPQPTLNPWHGSDAGRRGDRQLDGHPVTFTVAELARLRSERDKR